jgi:hypothetical protein
MSNRLPMDGMDQTFHTEIDNILEEFERRRHKEKDVLAGRKNEWKAAVHDFREIARDVIVPTLRELKAPLRDRGLRPYITNNTRQGLNIWLEVDGEQLKTISLSFRLDAARNMIEIDGLIQEGMPHRVEIPLDTIDRSMVEVTVVSFLRLLP